MSDELYDFNVTDRQSFVRFIELLQNDLEENPESWENATLPLFLEALGAYAKDIQGYYNNFQLNIDADKPDWKVFADIFKGAKVYE